MSTKMQITEARGKNPPERTTEYNTRKLMQLLVFHILFSSRQARTIKMASDHERDEIKESRRLSTTSTAGSFDSIGSDSTGSAPLSNGNRLSRRSSTAFLPPALRPYESDREDIFSSGYPTEGEGEESFQGK
jgi:hypothetical protein